MENQTIAKHKILHTFSILKFNILNIILFECIFNLLVTSVIVPVIKWFFAAAQTIAGVPYLTQDTAIKLLTNPLSDVIIFVLLIVLTYLCIFEINVLIINYTFRDVKRSVFQLVKDSAKKSLYVFKPKNWLVILFILFLLPLDQGLYITSISKVIVLPSFILEAFENNLVAQIVIFVVEVILALGVARCIFSFFYMVIDDSQSFFSAIKKSNKLIKGHFIRTIFLSLGLSLLLGIILMGIKYGFLYGMAYLIKAQASPDHYYQIYSFLFAITDSIGYFLGFCITFIAPIALVAHLFALYTNEDLTFDDKTDVRKAGHGILTTVAIIFVCLLFGLSGFVNYELRQDILLVAHRAGGAYRPENSLSALSYAIEIGADWAEMDVQQTKDGVLIISHDSNFNRLSHVNKNVWEVTYDEVLTYDNGSFFSPEYADEKYATLEQMLQMADNKINLIIELKANGHENNLEQLTVDLINQYDMKDQVYVASMDQQILENVRAYDPTMHTQLITALVSGDVQDIDYVDCLSIEKTFANSDFSFSVHAKQKKVFVWTVNDEQGMIDVINSDADGLITDDVIMAQKIKASATGDDMADEVARIVFGE